MPFIYQGKKLLSPEEYEQGYANKHPNKLPRRQEVVKRSPDVNRNTYLALIVVLLSINVLSGGHTIPTIASLYGDWYGGRFLIALAGFVGLEGALLFLMAQAEREEWEKRAILVAFTATIATNAFAVASLSFTSTVASDVNTNVLKIIGIFIGVVVPILNLAFGEVMHRLAVKRNQQAIEIDAEHRQNLLNEENRFNDDLAKYNDSWQKAYRAFLTRMGITNTEDREYVMSGFAEMDYLAGTVIVEPVEPVPQMEQKPVFTESAKVESFLHPLNPQ